MNATQTKENEMNKELLKELKAVEKTLTEYFDFRDGRGFGSIFDESLKKRLDSVRATIRTSED